MPHIITLANQKGGVGKTTSAINIGAALSEQGARVLLIDFDPQGNLSSGLGVVVEGNGIYDVLSGTCTIKQAVQRTVVGGLHVAGADIHLSGANVELMKQERREYFLQGIIGSLEAANLVYDYVLIDSPPSLGMLTINALTASDRVIVPLQCEYFALEGLKQLLASIRTVKNSYNPKLEISGILCTMYDSRTKLSQEIVGTVVKHFRDLVFRTIIPRNTRIAEAPSHGQPISIYDKYSTGAESYRRVATEVVERCGAVGNQQAAAPSSA